MQISHAIAYSGTAATSNTIPRGQAEALPPQNTIQQLGENSDLRNNDVLTRIRRQSADADARRRADCQLDVSLTQISTAASDEIRAS